MTATKGKASMEKSDLMQLKTKIQDLENIVLEIKSIGWSIPAVERNAVRIIASIKMLKINIDDIV